MGNGIRSHRELVTDRAVMLAMEGSAPAKAISQALWEHAKPHAKPRDHEDLIAETLAMNAAITLALRARAFKGHEGDSLGLAPLPALTSRALPPLPALLPCPGAEHQLDPVTTRALMDAPRHAIGRVLPNPRPVSPTALLITLLRVIALAEPRMRAMAAAARAAQRRCQQATPMTSTAALASKWRVVTR
jgi:hypothetical protein